MNAKEIQTTASTVVAMLAILINFLFILIICKKGQKNMGSYRYLMVSFAICNILYASIEFCNKPSVYIYGHSIMVYFNGYFGNIQWLEASLGYIMFSMNGIHTALLVLHFLYRYILVCKPQKRMYFENFNLMLWMIPVFLWALLHIFVVVYCYQPSSEYYDYAADAVQEYLHRDLNRFIFYCLLTHDVVDGEVRIYWKPTLGLSLIIFMMLTTFTVMVVFGVKTAKALQNKGLSKKTIKLQKQLLIALAVQAFIPLVLTYIPRNVTLLLPIMGISLPSILKFSSLVITLSITVLDPIAIILCINDYRCTVMHFIKKPLRSTVAVPTVTTVVSTSSKIVQK